MKLNARQAQEIAQSLGRRGVKAMEAATEFQRRSRELVHTARTLYEAGMDLSEEQVGQFIGRANALIVEYHDDALAVEMYGADAYASLMEFADPPPAEEPEPEPEEEAAEEEAEPDAEEEAEPVEEPAEEEERR